MSLHRVPNVEKGVRYLGLLDQALCNGQWSEVPELARKVEKHAPERKCTASLHPHPHIVMNAHVDRISQISPSPLEPNARS